MVAHGDWKEEVIGGGRKNGEKQGGRVDWRADTQEGVAENYKAERWKEGRIRREREEGK